MREQGLKSLATRQDDETTRSVDPIQALHEPLIGMAMAARVCRYHLARSEPNLDELRMLVAEMVDVADRTILILRQ